LLRHIFAVAGIASQFLHRNRKNVVYLFTLSGIQCIYRRLMNNEERIQNYSCPTIIRLTAPSLARGLRSKYGEHINEIRRKKIKNNKLYSFRACVRQAHQPDTGWHLSAFCGINRHE